MRVPVSLSVLLCGLAVTACSGSSGGGASFTQPPVSAFAAGTCRTVAPDVLAIGKQAQQLGDGGAVDKPVVDALEKAQTSLRPAVEAAEPSYQPALMQLVVATGLVRLQVSLGSYQVDTGKDLQKAYATAVGVCTLRRPRRRRRRPDRRPR